MQIFIKKTEFKLIMFFLTFSFSSCSSKIGFRKTFPDLSIYSSLKSGKKIKTIKDNSNLEDILNFALKNNPKLKSIYFLSLESFENYKSSGDLPDPVLFYSYYLQSVETRVGPQRHKIVITQKIPGFKKLKYKKKYALKKVELINSRMGIIKNVLLWELKKLYFLYYLTGGKIKILKDILNNIKLIEQLAKVKYRSENLNYSFILKIQLERGILVNKIQSLKSKLPTILSLMNSLIDGKIRSLKIPEKINFLSKVNDKKILLKLQKLNNPVIQKEIKAIELKNTKLSLEKIKKYPDFYFKAGVIETGESSMDVNDNGKDPVILTFGLSIPLWSSNNSKIKSVKAGLNYLKFKKQNMENILKGDLIRVYNNYINELRKIKFYKTKLIPLSVFGLKTAFTSYTTGKNSIINLWDLVDTILKLKLELITTYYKAALNLAGIEKYTGVSLSKKGEIK
jgi:outer membrane protein, heavy metal efflux system